LPMVAGTIPSLAATLLVVQAVRARQHDPRLQRQRLRRRRPPRPPHKLPRSSPANSNTAFGRPVLASGSQAPTILRTTNRQSINAPRSDRQ
jgi:hypothetical protein